MSILQHFAAVMESTYKDALDHTGQSNNLVPEQYIYMSYILESNYYLASYRVGI